MRQASNDHVALFSGDGRGGFVGGKLARCLAASTRVPARRPIPLSRTAASFCGGGYNRSAEILSESRGISADRVAHEVRSMVKGGRGREADELWRLWTQPRAGGGVWRGRPEVAGLVMSLCQSPNGKTRLHCAWSGDCRFALLRRICDDDGGRGGGGEGQFQCQMLSEVGASSSGLFSLDRAWQCRPVLMKFTVEEGDLVVAGSAGFWRRLGPADGAELAAQLAAVVNYQPQWKAGPGSTNQAIGGPDDTAEIGRRLGQLAMRSASHSGGDVTLFVARIARGAGCIAANSGPDGVRAVSAGAAGAESESDRVAGAMQFWERSALAKGLEELGPDVVASTAMATGR